MACRSAVHSWPGVIKPALLALRTRPQIFERGPRVAADRLKIRISPHPLVSPHSVLPGDIVQVPRKAKAKTSSIMQRTAFSPKVDAAVISSARTPAPIRPETVGPVYDVDNVDKPIAPWSQEKERTFYPPKTKAYTPASIPDRPTCPSDRYLRASLANNERLRLSMLWYYTRDITREDGFLSGLQEKLQLAQESTGWEFAVVGIQDVNFYIRLATIGLPLAILPRGETICAHTVTQPPGVR